MVSKLWLSIWQKWLKHCRDLQHVSIMQYITKHERQTDNPPPVSVIEKASWGCKTRTRIHTGLGSQSGQCFKYPLTSLQMLSPSSGITHPAGSCTWRREEKLCNSPWGDGTLVSGWQESLTIKPQLSRCSPSQGSYDVNVTLNLRVRTHLLPMTLTTTPPTA